MHRYALISLVLALLAIVCAPFDAAITRALDMTGETGDLRRITAMSEIFAHGFGVAIAVCLIFCFAPQRWRMLPRFLASFLLASLSVNLTKHLVIRRRPQSFSLIPDEVSETWNPPTNAPVEWNSDYLLQSFPSGHSATALCLAIGLSWLFPRGRFLFFTLAIMAMLQRVMFLAHWPSDVLFGAAIAVMVAGNVLTAPLSEITFGWLEKPDHQAHPKLIALGNSKSDNAKSAESGQSARKAA